MLHCMIGLPSHSVGNPFCFVAAFREQMPGENAVVAQRHVEPEL
jgi:hypothetical protein